MLFSKSQSFIHAQSLILAAIFYGFGIPSLFMGRGAGHGLCLGIGIRLTTLPRLGLNL